MKCEICGRIFNEAAWLPPYNNVCGKEKCFETKVWNNKYNTILKEPKRFAIVNGYCFYIGDENKHSIIKGFGGREFALRFKDGSITITTNLWDNGPVPDEFKDKFTDNAEFIGDSALDFII